MMQGTIAYFLGARFDLVIADISNAWTQMRGGEVNGTAIDKGGHGEL